MKNRVATYKGPLTDGHDADNIFMENENCAASKINEWGGQDTTADKNRDWRGN